MSRRIFVFPGQGSQKRGMGAELFPLFKEMTALADAELGYSVEELCVRDTANRLNQTQFTQPALFTVNAFTFLNRITETGELPDFVAGHSLGEYNALFAAGVFDFRTGLKLVQKRGELMSRARGGAMAAVVGLTAEQIDGTLNAAGLTALDKANFNAPNQIVISGPEQEVIASQQPLERAGAQLWKRLTVSAAFHSRYMAPAAQEFGQFLSSFRFASPKIPVIANVTARPYELNSVHGNLARQMTGSVRWTESMAWLLEQPAAEFFEVGPGNVLTGLIRRIQSGSALAG